MRIDWTRAVRLILQIFSFIFAGVLIAHAQIIPTIDLSAPQFASLPLATSTIALMVKQAEQEYDLDDKFYKTMEYESWGFQNIQSQVPHAAGPNGLEDSWGVAQIHLPDHSGITRKEALDPKFAIPWAAEHFKKNPCMWSAYKLLYGGCPE